MPSSASSAVTRVETMTEPSLTSATTVATISSTSGPVTISTESSTTAPTTTSWTPSPFASVITLTGIVQTVTITPTAPPAASATIQAVAPGQQNFLSDTGKAAGVFTGVALAVVLLAAFGIWFCCRRRRDTNGREPESENRAGRRSRMGGLPFAVKRRSGDWAGLTPLSTQGLAGGTANEKSPGDTISPASRRASYPMRIVDQRLDPGAWYPNGSHTSLASFRDDYDYSRRVLHVRPPPSAAQIVLLLTSFCAGSKSRSDILMRKLVHNVVFCIFDTQSGEVLNTKSFSKFRLSSRHLKLDCSDIRVSTPYDKPSTTTISPTADIRHETNFLYNQLACNELYPAAHTVFVWLDAPIALSLSLLQAHERRPSFFFMYMFFLERSVGFGYMVLAGLGMPLMTEGGNL